MEVQEPCDLGLPVTEKDEVGFSGKKCSEFDAGFGE